MSLRDLHIRKCYNSDSENPLQEFYIPVLKEAKNYKRITGSFTSGILAKAAQGIASLIANGGKMELIAGVQIQENDYQAIERATTNPSAFITDILSKEIGDIEKFLRDDHVEALAWMLANGFLEMKIAIVPPGNLSHMKVGIVEDMEGNKLSFSGSNNETPSGWEHNVEEFKVFLGWEESEQEYFMNDEKKFDDLWNGRAKRTTVVNLPQAISDKIIQRVKHRPRPRISKPPLIVESPGLSEPELPKEIVLRDSQLAAIKAWFASNRSGILSMATGSGKTITALSIVKKLMTSERTITVIAVPREHLAKQWINNDIRPMFPGISILEVHGGAGNWRQKLSSILPAFSTGNIKHLFIVGLYGSLASEDFTKEIAAAGIDPNYFVYIADEVHNVGAQAAQAGLLSIYRNRIGLSATPDRYFDEEGTDVIRQYFGKVVFEYPIKDAIKDGHLVPYNYYIDPVYLSSEEYEEYADLSKKVSRRVAIENNNHADFVANDSIKMLFLKRSKILKNASGKIDSVLQIIQKLIIAHKESRLSHVLIYCDNKIQVDAVQGILNDNHLINHRFTEEETADQRASLLKGFSDGEYQVLVAVKCLDEGVDIPESRIAIIVASTTNPREYIQRRGRVLRKAPNKTHSDIYDLLVLPPDTLSGTIDAVEQSILHKEFERIRDFVDTSQNPSESYQILLDIMKKYSIYL